MISRGLLSARRTLSAGWHPCLTLDLGGRMCSAGSDDARRWCLDDALAMFLDVDGQIEAWDLLQTFALPTHEQTLWQWLEAPGRTQAQVLELMDRAILRAQRMEADW
jgi:hypothetical protein